MSKLLTAGYINRHCKLNWGIADFSNHLNLSDEEFKELFFRSFSGKTAKDLWRKISKNRNSKSSSSVTTTASISTTTTTTTTVATTTTTTVTATSEISSSVESEIEAEPNEFSEEPVTSELAELEASRAALVANICKLENDHSSISSKRKDVFSTLAHHKEWIENYMKELEYHRNEVISLSKLASQYADDMRKLSNAISDRRCELADIEGKITLAKKVSILAYESGEIETENYNGRNIAEETPETWFEIFASIRDLRIAEELRVKEVKQVAQIIAFTRLLDACGTAFELTFENEVAQALFDACRK